GEDPIARRRELPEDDVARRLAAELGLPPLQLLPDVAVADLRADEPDAIAGERRFEAAVRHDRADDELRVELPVLREVPGREGEDEVAVEDGAGAVDGHDAVAVTVEGEADVGLVLDDRPLEGGGSGGAAAEIDVR